MPQLFLHMKLQRLKYTKQQIRTVPKEYNDLYVLNIGRRENQLKFMKLIYKDSKVFLIRKHDKFLQIPS